MIRGGETEEKAIRRGGGEGEEGETFSGDGGGNGALTVLHSGSSISITLWVSV